MATLRSILHKMVEEEDEGAEEEKSEQEVGKQAHWRYLSVFAGAGKDCRDLMQFDAPYFKTLLSLARLHVSRH